MAARGSEVQDLIRKINATKTFKVVKNGQKHYKVITAKGAAVVDENGPLIISSSPSEFRFREMTVKRLMGAGVFASDPYKETRNGAEANDGQKVKGQRGGGGSRGDVLQTPEARQRMAEAVQAKSRRLNEQTQHIRSDLEPLIVKMGGWGRGASGVTVADLARVMAHWAKSRGRMEFPAESQRGGPLTESALTQTAVILKSPGKTLGEKWLPIWRLFVDDLLEADKRDKKDGVRERWFQLYREYKGIPSEGGGTVPPMEPPANGNGNGHAPLRVVNGTVVARTPAEIGDDGTVKIGPLHHPTVPSLALEAMWLMAKGTDDQDRAMGVAEKILKLEIEGRA